MCSSTINQKSIQGDDKNQGCQAEVILTSSKHTTTLNRLARNRINLNLKQTTIINKTLNFEDSHANSLK